MATLAGQTLLGRYFLRERIDSGGMADVYLAWDQVRSTRMAIKVLRRDLAQSEHFLQMFNQEAEMLRCLEHPNIVRLYEFGKDSDIVFIVMDWVDGKNLGHALQEVNGPLSLAEVSRILGPVASALNYAHQNHIFHCDVKPANIMLHVDGRVLLTDFGVAGWAGKEIEGGTLPYMAPEQFGDAEVDARTDIYALGVTIYEMLTGGRVPFRGDSPVSQGSTKRERIVWEHLNLPVPPLRQYNPRISEAVDRVVARAMSKNREQRFGSTLALREAFERAAAAAQPDTAPGATVLAGRDGRETYQQHPGIPPATDQEKQWVSPPPQRQAVPPQPVPSRMQMRGAYLYCRDGALAGQAIPIPAGELTIGRGKTCLLRLNEPSVSRAHATIFRGRKGAVYLRDDNSTLGTFVNGNPIAGVVLLKPGDIIQIGYQQIFEFCVD